MHWHLGTEATGSLKRAQQLAASDGSSVACMVGIIPLLQMAVVYRTRTSFGLACVLAERALSRAQLRTILAMVATWR
jgi:hypothetical protein